MLLSTPACGPEADLPVAGELLYEGEYVDVYASSGTTICKGSFAEMDHFSHELRLYAQESNVSWSDEKFRYNWITQDEWSSLRPCPPRTAACFRPMFPPYTSTAYARGFSFHELAHAMFGPAHQSHTIFKEGLATILENETGNDLPSPDTFSLSSLYQRASTDLSAAEYSKAAFSTRFLLDTYRDSGMQAISSTSISTPFSEFEQILEHNGLHLSAIEEQLNRTPSCDITGIRLNFPECSFPEVSWTTLANSFNLNLSCDDSDAYGPIGNHAYKTITFNIPEDGSYEFGLAGTAEAAATIGRCGRKLCEYTDAQFEDYTIRLLKTETHTASLKAGKYWMSVRWSTETMSNASFFVRPAPEPSGEDIDDVDTHDTFDAGEPDTAAEGDPPSGTPPLCDSYKICMPSVVSSGGITFEYGFDDAGQPLTHIITDEQHNTALQFCSCQLPVVYTYLRMEEKNLVEIFETLALQECLKYAEDEIALAVEAQGWPEEQVATQIAAATMEANSECKAAFQRRYLDSGAAVPFIVEEECLVAEPELACTPS